MAANRTRDSQVNAGDSSHSQANSSLQSLLALSFQEAPPDQMSKLSFPSLLNFLQTFRGFECHCSTRTNVSWRGFSIPTHDQSPKLEEDLRPEGGRERRYVH